MHPFVNKEVEARINEWPAPVRQKLLDLRALIFETGDAIDGDIEESLKWNVPSYLNRREGTPIRLDAGKNEGEYGLYVHCQTTLISTMREIYPDVFSYEKNRAILFTIDERIAASELRHFISMALTYHRKK